jgi:putative phosphoesterase
VADSKRIALFSDIHSNYHALEAVLADMSERGLDQMVCLGDLTIKGPLPTECVARVRDLDCPVLLGNTDACYHPDLHPSRYPPRNLSQIYALQDFERHVRSLSEADRIWLHSRPLTLSQEVGGQRLDLFHAAPHTNYLMVMPWASNEELLAQRLTAETNISAFGHSHRAFVRNVENLTVINTGSVGLPYDGDWRPSYVVVQIDGVNINVEVVRVEYDPEPAIKAAQDRGMKGWEFFAKSVRTGLFPG